MDGRVRRAVQEPPLSRARHRRSAPVGAADRARYRRQGRERRLGAAVARCHERARTDGHARRHDEPVHEPQSRAPADCHRHSGWPVERGRRFPIGHGERGRREPEIRRDVEPDGRLHLQPRLLADRIGSAADRNQPAVSGVVSGASPVLSRRAGNFQSARSRHVHPHAHDCRPSLRREAVRENREDDARASRRQRRSAGQDRQPPGPRLWANGAVRCRARALRSVPRVDDERHLHESRVHESAQPRDWRRRRLCLRADASVLRACHRDRPSRCRRRAAQGLLLRLQPAEGRPQRELLAHQQRHQPGPAHRRGIRAPHRSAADARQHLVSVVAGTLAHRAGRRG